MFGGVKKLTYSDPEIFEEILKYREQGVSIKSCAEYVGMSERTLHRILKKGESKKSKYYDFAKKFKKATAKAVIYHQSEANRKCITVGDHLKILKILEPDRYTSRIKADVNVNEKSPSVDELAKNAHKILWEE